MDTQATEIRQLREEIQMRDWTIAAYKRLMERLQAHAQRLAFYLWKKFYKSVATLQVLQDNQLRLTDYSNMDVETCKRIASTKNFK
jgi:hypothetical protein